MSSWKPLAALVLAVTVVTVFAGPIINKCTLQKDTADKQFELSTLDGLFGLSLTTYSNGNFYIVSICRPISQANRQFTGAVKISSQGYSIDLGRIDQSNIIINENTIVLTYVGGDEDRDPRDKCRGLRWTTYLLFVCDPSSTEDVLILIDEDPDQPEICQIWFEIRTSKTCVRELLYNSEKHSNGPNKLLNNDMDGKTIDSNHIPYNRKPYNYTAENNRSAVANNSIDIMPKDNTRNTTNGTDSHKTDFEKKLFFIKSKIKQNTKFENNNLNQNNTHDFETRLLIGEKSKNNESTINNYIPEEKSPDNQKKYFNENYLNSETKKIFTQNNISHYENFKDKPSVNKKYINYENTTISQEEKNHFSDNNGFKNIDNERNNIDKNNKPINEKEMKNGNLIQDASKSRSSENKNSVVNDNYINKRNVHNDKSFNELFSNPENRNISSSNDEQNNISNENKLKNTKNNDYINEFDKEEKLTNENGIKNGNSTQINSKVQLHEKLINNETNLNENINPINKSFREAHYNIAKKNKTINNEDSITENTKNNNIEDELSNNHFDKENKFANNENKNDNINQDTAENNLYFNNNNTNNLEKNRSILNNKSEDNISNKNDTLNTNNKVDKYINEKNNTYSESNQNGDKFLNNDNINSVKNDKLATNETETINSLAHKENNVLNTINKGNYSLSNSTQNNDYVEEPSSSEDAMSKKNFMSIENKNKDINYNSSVDDDNTTVIDMKHSTNNILPTTFYADSITTPSAEIENSQNNKTAEELFNNKSKSNSSLVKVINNAAKKIQSQQSNQNTENNKNYSVDITSKSEDNSDSGGFFAKLFPNGIQFNAATISLILGFLLFVSVLIGTAVNRYYYKLSGTEQIPCKGTIQNIYSHLKGYITKVFCCCCDSKPFDFTNERTPLLQPEKITKAVVQEETSQKYDSSSDETNRQQPENPGNDINGQNNKYGSISNESHSRAPDEIYSQSKAADLNSSNSGSRYQNSDKDIPIKTENNKQNKSIIDVVNGQINTVFNTKVIPNIDSIFKKVRKSAGNLKKKGEKENTVQNVSNDIKSSDNSEEGKEQDKLEISSHLENLEKELINKLEIPPIGSNNENKGEKPKNLIKIQKTNEVLNESDNTLIPEEKNNGDINSKVLPDFQVSLDDDQINEFEQELINKSIISKLNLEHKKTNKLEIEDESDEVKKVNIIDENNKTKQKNSENFEQKSPNVDIETKINESELKLLDLINNENEKKELLNESNVSDNNQVQEQVEDKDNNTIEIIEEIFYVDDADGFEDGDEIIEEIIETTTVQNSPETGGNSESSQSLNTNNEHATVSTIRKTSLHKASAPDDVILLEETEGNDDKSQNEKKPFGLQFGIGKSGVNVSVGDKKMGIGKSGVKFGKREEQENENNAAMTIKLDKSGLKLNRNKNKIAKNDDSEEVDFDKFDERESTSQEKVKISKSIPNFKIFKRSISHPTESDIQEVNEGVPKKKLLKFRKSRSKSTSVLTTDVHVLSNFIDHERSVSQIDLYESKNNNEKIVDRKKSTSSPYLLSPGEK